MKNQHSLKIAVIVGKFPTVSETYIINQIGYLKQSGHKILILCTRHIVKDYMANAAIDTNNLMDDVINFTWRELMPLIKYHRLFKILKILIKSIGSSSFKELVKSLNVFKYKGNAINGSQFFREYFKQYFVINNFDVVHIHFADNAVYLSNHLKNFKNRVVVTFHGYDAHNFNKSFYSELLKINNIQYTVNTKFTRQKILALGFPESAITILPVGLDTSFFRPTVKGQAGINILFVGRLIELKGSLIAINIIEELIKKGYLLIHLHIIGEGEDYEKCKKQIIDKKLNDFVSLHGHKSQEGIKEHMNISDIFLFPGIIDSMGRCEAQGLVVQEAQAMQLPVFVSNIGGVKEGVLNEITGYVVKEKGINGFVEKLEYLINNPITLKTMGEKGRRFVIDRYDNKVLGEKLLKIYRL